MEYVSTFQLGSARVALELSGIDAFNVAGWDGEDAEPVSDGCVYAAKAFLDRLSLDVPVGNAMAGTDGSLGLYWERQDVELYVDFRVDGRIRVYYTDGEDLSRELVLPIGTFIDDILESVGPALLMLTTPVNAGGEEHADFQHLAAWWVQDYVLAPTNYALAA
ncbi:hypothetical protein [Caballeronia sordidicola]|uniref:hypothetical protein n=1 Tax=Caballeronia sordidicola TaxID=196367 RepID=UPI00094C372F|nr:hypothetical protein [Caballeronia sordidicola]